jgi:putative toxin-antitoxin system antitoxin component (TIGR02293 family)
MTRSFEPVTRPQQSIMAITYAETFHLLLPNTTEQDTTPSALEVALQLRQGVPVESVDALRQQTGLRLVDVLDAVSISYSTFKRRRQRSERLSSDASDTLFRMLYVFRTAAEVLGSDEKARTWLVTPSRALDHHRPLDLLRSSLGARVVEDELAALDHGFLA